MPLTLTASETAAPCRGAVFHHIAYTSTPIWTRDRLGGHPFQLHFSRGRRMGRRWTNILAEFAIRADERPASRHGAEGRHSIGPLRPG